MTGAGPAEIGFDQQGARIVTPRQGQSQVDSHHRLALVAHRTGDEQLLQPPLVLHVRQTGRQYPEHLRPLLLGSASATRRCSGVGRGTQDAVGRDLQPSCIVGCADRDAGRNGRGFAGRSFRPAGQ